MAILRARPSESEKEPLLLFMTATRLLDLKVKNGDPCKLAVSENGTSHSAIAWTSSKSDLKDGVVGVSKWLQEQCGVKLGNEVSITKSDTALEEADAVPLLPISRIIPEKEKVHWEYVAHIVIPEQHKYLAAGQKVSVALGKQREEFKVTLEEGLLYRVGESTNFPIGIHQKKAAATRIIFDWSGIGGLQWPISQIEDIMDDLQESPNSSRCCPPAQGVLLYGPKGTGKSLLREAIAGSGGWNTITNWTAGTKISNAEVPHLVLVDFYDKWNISSVVELLQAIRAARGTTTVFLGEARHPNDLDDRLRNSNGFQIELELPIPDSIQRLEILKACTRGALPGSVLESASERTHGFVGSDLESLFYWTCHFARKNQKELTLDNHVTEVEEKKLQRPKLEITIQDLDKALTRVRPSALQEVFLEKPSIRWSDIGGHHDIKKELQDAIEWPLKYPDELQKLGLDATKGVLLYGPPGCSKTLLVKALATESDLNFLAVKGAELVSMFVGESERATREVFRKARAASPCIIFFDEIDAIASRSKSTSDLNVLTTLLNEMDGFEELKNVLVVAATNKPQSVDPALMRPGRFDNVVYIGPPDEQTRKEILKGRFNKFSYDEDVRNNIDDFAERTEGFSGAEVVAVCKTAAKFAFSAGRTSTSMDDMNRAISNTPRSITKEILAEYENWIAARRL